MKRKSVVVFFVLVLICLQASLCVFAAAFARHHAAAGSAADPAVTGQYLNVWPHPASWKYVSQQQPFYMVINKPSSFALDLSGVKDPSDAAFVKQAFKRYQNLIFYDSSAARDSDCPSSLSIAGRPGTLPVRCMQTLRVTIDPNSKSAFNHPVKIMADDIAVQDESYRLALPSAQQQASFDISARSTWGVLRALETLSQLASLVSAENLAGKQFYVVNTPQSLPIQVDDAPRFPWRGFLLDTSRHYFSTKQILKLIDTLSYFKFNTLHWHIVDANSFPLVVPDVPLLSKAGAFDPRAVYTPEDIAMITEYASLRGMQVLPEIDQPGHAFSWGNAYPESIANCPKYSANIANVPLNPASNITFELLDRVLGHVAKSFSSQPFIHIGGDELLMACWDQDAGIQAFKKAMGFTQNDQLLNYMEQRVFGMMQKYGKKIIAWQELLLNHDQSLFKLPKDSIIQAWWRDPQPLVDITSKGFRALTSGGWYLDQQVPSRNGTTRYEWVDTWIDFYDNEPYVILKEPAHQKLLLGGTACMWTEQVERNLDSRVFPRVLGAAERLWSPQNLVRDGKLTTTRLEYARCNVLSKRGVNAGPVMPGFCPFSYDWQ